VSNKPFIAARIEHALDARIERLLRAMGWRERVIAYTGYGNSESARVLGRIVLVPPAAATQLGQVAEEFLARRGWRNFFTAVCVNARYTLSLGDAEVSGVSDRGGYIDHRIRGHGLNSGWHRAWIRSEHSQPSEAQVTIIPDDAEFGIVSDIDDTVISTWLPRPMIAAWNTFIRTESARQAIPGMAVLYNALLDDHPGSPMFYLSTGAWNTHASLHRFLLRHRYPMGPMLLTDWGPTNTGWFRSGQAHKRRALLQLTLDFPRIRWVLVGDDGQHDPQLYSEFAQTNPDRVHAIAIRQLSLAQQFLAHGTVEPIEQPESDPADTPVIRAADGRGLLVGLRRVLAAR
jgi:phosphatidate phosphatase APP1